MSGLPVLVRGAQASSSRENFLGMRVGHHFNSLHRPPRQIPYAACISKVMVVLARAGELIPDDDDGPCAQRKAAIAALPKFVGGVLCAKTPRGRPCTRTLQTFFTMSGQLGGANGTDASDAAFFAGASQQWQDQRSLRGGVALAQMCADFQDTGCCFGSVHALVQDHDMRAVSFHVGLHTSIPDAAVDDALRTLQTQCRQQMLPHSNIGASACVP